MACDYQLWSHINMTECSSVGNASFEGFVANKHTKDINTQISNIVANDPRQPPGTLE